MLGALAGFTLMDAAAKGLTDSYHAVQISWLRFALNAGLLSLLFARSLPQRLRSRQPRLQIARAIAQLVAVLLFFLALRHIGLAEATALADLNPVIISLAAAFFLGESLGPRRIVGIALAFLGALIILRPGAGVFHPASLLAVGTAVGFAAAALFTRLLRAESPVTSLLWSSWIGLLVMSAPLPAYWQPIAPKDLWLFGGLGLAGLAGQAFMIAAFSRTEAGVLAPFGYTGLVFASLWGILFFGQWPDLWTVVGALVIVGSGLYVWSRERKQTARPSRAEPGSG